MESSFILSRLDEEFIAEIFLANPDYYRSFFYWTTTSNLLKRDRLFKVFKHILSKKPSFIRKIDEELLKRLTKEQLFEICLLI